MVGDLEIDDLWLQKSTQDDVIRAVELEHNQALLVYASDRAISDEVNVELSSTLKVSLQSFRSCLD